ncbi:hypothetical protein QVD17_35089 [Tagetes erecta]|uniref:Reverse transcriptase zinc-binding domain-containing protein n=1 Tax=Tagetes erecta TaxID=13708 RepID=A0AAD8JZ90_TARER|nr:hypothetical protein QVD17_35089 [Tagetes erecta]
MCNSYWNQTKDPKTKIRDRRRRKERRKTSKKIKEHRTYLDRNRREERNEDEDEDDGAEEDERAAERERGEVRPSEVKDGWTWSEDKDGIYTVASMKKILYNSHSTTGNFCFPWNNWVPKKINIFSWKAVLDRLPTRVAIISQRNIQTTSIMCGLCQAEPETTEHPS